MNCKYSAVIFIVFIALSIKLYSYEDKFYNYYEKGLQYMKTGDFNRAIVEFKSAYSLQFEDAKKKRTYGTKFIEYFPHRETGVCYYLLEEYDNARQELELSVSYKKSDRAEEYLKKITTGITHTDENRNKELAKLEEKKKQLALEQEKLEKERKEKELKDKEALAKKEEERRQKELKDKEKRLQEKSEQEKLAQKKEMEAQEKERIRQEKLLKEKNEKEALALKKEREAIQKEMEELEKRKIELDKDRTKANVPLTSDLIKITRVGSPLSVAIMPIETTGENVQISSMILDKLITNLVKKRRFKVIEREFLEKIINEQALGMSGIVDEETAISAGKVIGAEAIIMGKQFELNGDMHISVRVIDVETSETITANEIVSEDDELERAMEKVAVMIINDMPLFEGTVIKVDPDQIYMDIGADLGVRKGTKFTIYRKGEEIKHPSTGEVLGYNVTPLGEAVTINVQDKMSIAKIVKSGAIQIGDKAVIK
jgi:TolB-like protein